MDEATKKQFDAILKERQEAADAKQRAVTRAKTEQEKFIERFNARMQSTIKPALDEIAAYLRGQGCECEVTEGTPFGASTNAITIKFVEPGAKIKAARPTDVPHVSFLADPNGKVGIYECTVSPGHGGSSGRRPGEFDLDAIDGAFVSDAVLRVFRKAISGTGF